MGPTDGSVATLTDVVALWRSPDAIANDAKTADGAADESKAARGGAKGDGKAYAALDTAETKDNGSINGSPTAAAGNNGGGGGRGGGRGGDEDDAAAVELTDVSTDVSTGLNATDEPVGEVDEVGAMEAGDSPTMGGFTLKVSALDG